MTLVHKGNIMKFTEGGFKKWGYELAEREFGEALADGRLVIKDCIADAFLQNTLLIPEEYSVIATLNLNGDYVSDQLAAMEQILTTRPDMPSLKPPMVQHRILQAKIL